MTEPYDPGLNPAPAQRTPEQPGAFPPVSAPPPGYGFPPPGQPVWGYPVPTSGGGGLATAKIGGAVVIFASVLLWVAVLMPWLEIRFFGQASASLLDLLNPDGIGGALPEEDRELVALSLGSLSLGSLVGLVAGVLAAAVSNRAMVVVAGVGGLLAGCLAGGAPFGTLSYFPARPGMW